MLNIDTLTVEYGGDEAIQDENVSTTERKGAIHHYFIMFCAPVVISYLRR